MKITKDDPRFQTACQNTAAFIWSNWSEYGETKEEFWNALPDSSKQAIEQFIQAEKAPPIRK